MEEFSKLVIDLLFTLIFGGLIFNLCKKGT